MNLTQTTINEIKQSLELLIDTLEYWEKKANNHLLEFYDTDDLDVAR